MQALNSKPTPSIVVIDVPQRENGGKLPTLRDLQAISALCKAKNVHLHMDGGVQRCADACARAEQSVTRVCIPLAVRVAPLTNVCSSSLANVGFLQHRTERNLRAVRLCVCFILQSKCRLHRNACDCTFSCPNTSSKDPPPYFFTLRISAAPVRALRCSAAVRWWPAPPFGSAASVGSW